MKYLKFSGAAVLIVSAALQLSTVSAQAEGKLHALIIDGQNNHDWRSTTPILKWILEDSGRFTVTVSTTPPYTPRQPNPPKPEATAEQRTAYTNALAKWKSETENAPSSLWPKWRPNFSAYDVVIGNYSGEAWPEEVRKAFVEFVRSGHGFVSVHAADNSFPEWPEYNQMIGVGGWGNRNEKSGPMLRLRDGKIVPDTTPGAGGTHGAQHEFLIEARVPNHPILKGLPHDWLHATDELYAKLRGPAEHLTVLATAFSAPNKGGTGEHEPMLMVIDFGKGRVFHTTLGHSPKTMTGLGFQSTFARGAEWAATGKVTLPAPEAGLLSATQAALRTPNIPTNAVPVK